MEQENLHADDISQQVKMVENLPELQEAFKNIEELKGNTFINNSETLPDNYLEDNVTNSDDINEDNPIKDNEALTVQYKDKKVDKYRKLQNDKYRALAEKEEALKRAAELEEMLKESLNSGTYHYSKSAYSDLEKAKEEKRRAFEEGDIDAYLNADIALIKSMNAINDLEKWAKENDQIQTSVPNNFNSNNYSEVHAEIAKDWIEGHPYLQPNSRSYNPELAENVTEFINRLDNNLYRNNEADVIFSNDYFETIDNYISSINKPKRNNNEHIESFSNVGSVRNTSFSNAVSESSPNRVLLTSDEKLMADNAGISHKDWLKFKLKEYKKR